ncbi:MAG: lipoprotein NlpI [Elusimicrobia bacterium ADurb.Bin231]|nr:MAG: lipoprotein NlpI [Elusimicrobia bacterium ADurb.Bin231]
MGIFAGTCGILVDNILNVSLYFVIPGFFFWINLGIFSVLAESNKKIINHNLFSKIAAVFLILLSFSGIIHYTRIFIAEKDYFTGFNLVKNPNIPLESSVVYLERAHKNRRLEVNTNYELANTYARISAQYRYAGNMEKAEDFQKKAIWAYKESLAANPGYDEIYFNLATIQSQRREFDSALENYKRAVFINPHSSDGLSTLGNLYLSKGELFAARNAFRQSLHINPLNKDIWNNLGYVNMKLGFKDEARDAYQKALEIDPNFDMARKNLFNLPR